MARVAILVATALMLLAPGTALAGWSVQESDQVDALVSRFLEPREGKAVPAALSISLGVDGELVLAKGFGQARQGTLATERTVYHIGSLTKQFTAAAMFKLIERGVPAPRSGKPLALETSASDIFEGVDNWAGRGEPPITVRSLLTMTSNLPNFTRNPPPEADPWGSVETPRLLAALKRQSPHGWPNTFEYSNTGYFLLAYMIEAALSASEGRRVSPRDFIRAELLRPAGLQRTGFIGDYAPGSELAEAHYRRRPAFAQPHWLDGCGDMASNVVDLFAWHKGLMSGDVISAASREAMFSDAARVDPLTYYGMGWFVGHEDDWNSYHHSGSVPGFTSYSAILKHRRSGRWISVTLLTNSDGVEGLDQLGDDILSIVRDLP